MAEPSISGLNTSMSQLLGITVIGFSSVNPRLRLSGVNTFLIPSAWPGDRAIMEEQFL
jgi:hypothetical protein